jgi:hypothetical protein
MSELRLGGRALVVCDVCLAYVDGQDPSTATWQRETPGERGGPDRCSDCAVPPRSIVSIAAALGH